MARAPIVRYCSGVKLGRAWRPLRHVLVLLLRGLWLSTMVVTPLFGAWLASALAAYCNGTQWLSLLVGLLLFPILPVGWDLWFVWRMRKRPDRRRILTRVDRLVLRTLLVNGTFIALVFWIRPGLPYRALSERGDWMLDGYDGAIASRIRGTLLWIADRMPGSWHHGAHYGDSDQPPPDVEGDAPAPQPPRPVVPDGGVLPPLPPPDDSGWPFEPTIDVSVTTMPADAQVSIESVGRYFASAVPDPRRRVKAIHDFVTQRLTYDDDALAKIVAKDWEHVPSEEAADVFAARRGVCAGYAHLMTAIGKAAGVEIAYVTGYARGPLDARGVPLGGEKDSLAGSEHAWNAAHIGNRWYLVDATWDDGDDKYETTYLFTPPAWFGYDHLPDDATWQLVATPRSTAEFVRQPAVNPRLGVYGLSLISPTRSQISVSGSAEVVLDNPYGALILATVSPGDRDADDVSARRDCAVARGDGTHTIVTCGNLGTGEYRLDLFAGPRGGHTGEDVGSIWVNSR